MPIEPHQLKSCGLLVAPDLEFSHVLAKPFKGIAEITGRDNRFDGETGSRQSGRDVVSGPRDTFVIVGEQVDVLRGACGDACAARA
jgi:hypothetical protein